MIGAEAELKKAIEEMDDQKIKVELLKESINWIKNPASAHNFGCLGKTNKVNQKRHEWTHQRTQQLPGRRFTEDLPLQNGVHNQQQTSDSGDSKRSPLHTTIIARYAAYWKENTCAVPTCRV